MAMWSSLAGAASATHLPGAAEALRLVTLIVKAAQTVRQNKRKCRQLARRAQLVGELLQQLQGSEVMLNPVTRRPLQALEETLRAGHQLVVSCQGSAATYRFLMGRKHASQLREMKKEIDSYLLLIPLVSHVHGTCSTKFAATDAAYGPSHEVYLL